MTRRSLAALTLLFAANSLFAQTTPAPPANVLQNPPSTQTGFAPKKFQFIAPTRKPGEEAKIEADLSTMERDEYAILQGNVHITYQDVKLTSDKATYNFKTKDAVAEGHVVLDQGPTRLTADHAVFNIESKTGTLFKANGSLQADMYFTGDKLEKLDEDSYRLTNGVITSCDIDRPAWSFHVGLADITLSDYAHMQDVSIRARRLPLIWVPRLIWPTKTDRAQGFLIPRLLLSNPNSKGGFGSRLELGYFYPIGESVDVTGYADVSTKGYRGVGFDMRYVPSPNVKTGEFSAYVIHNPDPDPTVVGEKARTEWRYQYQHAQDNLPGGFRGVIDVQDYSDLDFFRRYDRDPRLNTLSNIYSSAYLTKNQPRFSFNILTDRRDIFLGHVTSSESSPVIKQRFEQLPAFQFRMFPQRVMNTPVYFSLESSASHLRTNGLTSGPNADYHRFDVFPTLSLQLRTPAWLSVKPQLSIRETHYSAQLDEQSIVNPFAGQTAIERPLNRNYAQAQVEVVGPSFSRIFNDSIGPFTKFKHVIEPRIRYIYTTDVINDQNRVIRFDTVDTPYLPIVRDSVEYSITQRIIAREKDPKSSPREILSFSLRQTASLSKPFTSATGGNLPSSPFGFQSDNKFTPLVAQLHLNPYQSITADAQATYGNVSHQVDQTSLSANLIGTGKWSDKYLGFTWFANFRTPVQTSSSDPSASVQTPASHQIRLNTGSLIMHDRLRADVSFNWDSTTGRFLEQRYLVGGNASCWGLAAEYRRYFTFDRGFISTVGIAVTLKNVGTIGTH
jgi:LPS-assembly protein